MFNGSNCDLKSQLSGILTEPERGFSRFDVTFICYNLLRQEKTVSDFLLAEFYFDPALSSNHRAQI